MRRIATQAKATGLEWVLDHDGGKHSVYRLDDVMIPIPRHAGIDNILAEVIYRECAVKFGKGWWR